MTCYSFDFDIDPMTLIDLLKLELDVVKMYLQVKMKFLATAVQKLWSQQTDRLTD